MTRANPSVNRYLDDKAMDHIDHALGRPVWPLRETYRNCYAADASGDVAKAFDASPHWHLSAVDRNGMAYYTVTDAGRQALADHLATITKRFRAYAVTYEGHTSIVPAKSRSAAKYSLYLDIADSFSELRFGDFVKASTARVAP